MRLIPTAALAVISLVAVLAAACGDSASGQPAPSAGNPESLANAAALQSTANGAAEGISVSGTGRALAEPATALDRVPEGIDEAVEAVGDPIQISGVTFTIEDPDALLADARAEAMADAKAKAQQLAGLGGVTLGRPIAINEGSTGGPPPIFYKGELAQGAAEA